jgi:two-component system, cell cycle response regulator DivK
MSIEVKVCLIEDYFPIRKLFSNLLKKDNFLVVDFSNAKDAIDWLNQNKPDIILLDILLPELNGLDAIKIIRGISGLESVPIIAITGFALNTDFQKYIQAGFNGYMTKPVNVSTFGQDIKDYLKQ